MVEAIILLALLGSTEMPPHALEMPAGVMFVHAVVEGVYL